MAAVAGIPQQGANAMSPIDKSLYPTYRPIIMKQDEKTAQSISEDSDSEKVKPKKDKKEKEKKKKEGKKKKKSKSKASDKEAA